MRNPAFEIEEPDQIRSRNPQRLESSGEPSAFGLQILSPVLALLVTIALYGCTSGKPRADRSGAARTLLQEAGSKALAASTAAPADRQRIQEEAISSYLKVSKSYPEQSNICAQALRSAGNIRASQTNVDSAVKLYSQVGEKYRSQYWEVVQAWKSAADVLSECGRREEARSFYAKLVKEFDDPDQPSIVKMVVKGAKARLNE